MELKERVLELLEEFGKNHPDALQSTNVDMVCSWVVPIERSRVMDALKDLEREGSIEIHGFQEWIINVKNKDENHGNEPPGF